MSKPPAVDYFKAPNPLWFVVILPAMVYMSLLAYQPEIIPFERLGPLGTFSKYLYQNHKLITILTFWAAWGAHVIEAVYVVKLGKAANLSASSLNKWFFQTFCVGYPSTKLMVAYSKRQKRQ